jgi:hypothetical protein
MRLGMMRLAHSTTPYFRTFKRPEEVAMAAEAMAEAMADAVAEAETEVESTACSY